MTKAKDYCANPEISNYADDMSLCHIGDLKDEQFDLLLKISAELSGAKEPGIDNTVTRCNEDVANFENSRATYWKECRRAQIFDGYALYEGVQMRKGDQRRDFAVMEIGDGRSLVIQ